MKKLIVFILLLMCFATTFVFKNQSNPIFAMNDIEKVCFVDEKSYADKLDVESVQCGDLVFNFCSLQAARENISRLGKFKAMQVYFSFMQISEILENLKAELVSQEFVDGIEIVNAYTPYFSDSVLVQNKKVNLQIAKKEGSVIAGFPMILTGF